MAISTVKDKIQSEPEGFLMIPKTKLNLGKVGFFILIAIFSGVAARLGSNLSASYGYAAEKTIQSGRNAAVGPDSDITQARKAGRAQAVNRSSQDGGDPAEDDSSLRFFPILPENTPVSQVVPARNVKHAGHSFDLRRDHFIVDVPAGTKALIITLRCLTPNGNVDLGIRVGKPVDVANSRLIIDYRGVSNGNAYAQWTINSDVASRSLEPGYWYIAVGNASSFPARYSLNVEVSRTVRTSQNSAAYKTK
jgi:hypothetical protein